MLTFWLLIFGMTGASLLWVAAPFVIHRSQYGLLSFLLPALFLFSIVTYWFLGSHRALSQFIQSQKINTEAAAVMKTIHSPEQVIAMLQAHLAQNPNSAKGWYLLGQIYFSEKKNKEAIAAFDHAAQLAPRNADYVVSDVEAKFINQDQHLTAVDQKMLEAVLKKNPNNVGALSLIAMNAYTEKNYALAIATWERMLPFFPTGSSDNEALLKAIAKAQKVNALSRSSHK